MPKEKLVEMIKAFGKMKNTILWQFDGDVPGELPENVIMQKWFPQNDILENKRVVLFITHGEFSSFLWHIYFYKAVPFISRWNFELSRSRLKLCPNAHNSIYR